MKWALQIFDPILSVLHMPMHKSWSMVIPGKAGPGDGVVKSKSRALHVGGGMV